MSNDDSSAPSAPSTRAGFFQLSLADLHLITKDGGGYNELAAYIVLCSGVNVRHGERYCTHGAKSVEKRAGISYRTAEKAITWLHEAGFIEKPSADAPDHLGKGRTKATKVQWVLAGTKPTDVAMSHQFVDGVKGTRGAAPLKMLIEQVNGTHDIRRMDAVIRCARYLLRPYARAGLRGLRRRRPGRLAPPVRPDRGQRGW